MAMTFVLRSEWEWKKCNECHVSRHKVQLCCVVRNAEDIMADAPSCRRLLRNSTLTEPPERVPFALMDRLAVAAR